MRTPYPASLVLVGEILAALLALLPFAVASHAE